MMEVRNLAGSGDLKDTQSYGTVHYGVPYRKVPNGNLKKKRREKKAKQVESNGSRRYFSSRLGRVFITLPLSIPYRTLLLFSFIVVMYESIPSCASACGGGCLGLGHVTTSRRHQTASQNEMGNC